MRVIDYLAEEIEQYIDRQADVENLSKYQTELLRERLSMQLFNWIVVNAKVD